VRSGAASFAEVLRLIEEAETKLSALVEGCAWRADLAAIDAFLVRAHLAHWGANRS
jgi:hypothetical protein